MKPFDAVRESQQLQRTNTHPVDIDLVPTQTVTRRGRMRVMVVVPAFTKRQQRYPPGVTLIVVCLKSCLAPQMSRRIHEPRRV